jgi:hypothetical protein
MSSIITIGGDLVVGRIGFGAMQLTGKQVWGEYPDRDGAIALLRAVVDAGVNFIDTADVYGPHTNELLIREALYPCTARRRVCPFRVPRASGTSRTTSPQGKSSCPAMTRPPSRRWSQSSNRRPDRSPLAGTRHSA